MTTNLPGETPRVSISEILSRELNACEEVECNQPVLTDLNGRVWKF